MLTPLGGGGTGNEYRAGFGSGKVPFAWCDT
jgi:hypothetical protein